MKYILDLNDERPPIECASEQEAIFLGHVWAVASATRAEDAVASLRELRTAYADLQAHRIGRSHGGSLEPPKESE